MKSIIIYGSHHHGSTQILVEGIAQTDPVELWDAESGKQPVLSDYDLIGFASGIDFGKFYPAVTEIANSLPEGKRVCALYTCARDSEKYGNEIREIAQARGCIYLGKLGCKGYNTYGPWKLIGGINKGHPTQEEMAAAAAFYKGMLEMV